MQSMIDRMRVYRGIQRGPVREQTSYVSRDPLKLHERGFDSCQVHIECVPTPMFVDEDIHTIHVIEEVVMTRTCTFHIAAPSERDAIDLLCDPNHEFKPNSEKCEKADIRSRKCVERKSVTYFSKKYEIFRKSAEGYLDLISKHENIEDALNEYSKLENRDTLHLHEYAVTQEVRLFIRRVF